MFEYRDILGTNDLFQNQPFSKREAFAWIIVRAQNTGLSVTTAILATKWQWHASKVKRFLTNLAAQNLIKKEIKSGRLFLSLIDQTVTKYRTAQIIADIDLAGNSGTNAHQNQTGNIVIQTQRTKNGPEQVQDIAALQKTCVLQSDCYRTKEEEKKKSTKKRKEEESFKKEKNIPYGDRKKEKIVEQIFEQQNTQLTCNQNLVPLHLVSTTDVASWAEATLPLTLDLSWELGKFQDYWRSTRKKPPKDGAAAFRNWLRKAVEIKINKGDKNDRVSYKGTKRTHETSQFERFIAGGARALAGLK